MSGTPAILWFRQDLRLDDNPALAAAVELGGPVIPVYIQAPDEEGKWTPGAASRWWLHQSLKSLAAELKPLGSRLIIRRGPSLETLRELVRKTGARACFWNRRYEPAVIRRDKQIKQSLDAEGLEVRSFNGSLLFEPWDIQTKQSAPYQVYTPFWKTCLAKVPPVDTFSAPTKLHSPVDWPASISLDDLGLEPRIAWTAGMHNAWTPGSAGALARLERFLDDAVDEYGTGRNLPHLKGTSQLSPHLHFGEISIRRVWQRVMAHARSLRASEKLNSAEIYLAELGWREFAHHLLYHFPNTTDRPLRAPFEKFPWESNRRLFDAWKRGRTGYPIVDAGMRELWTTGWMHNRVRMIVSSFLTKDLLISWQEGAAWFWDTLVDADLANNTLGWQWTAGCGADAAPFFRIFNPVSQGEKFDAEGEYIRRWVPEIAKLPTRFLHEPWKAPRDVLAAANVQLGENYPRPIVDHAEARKQALALYRSRVSLK